MGMTGYFTHPTCWKHEMGKGHPECPERLGAIEDRLLISGVDMALQRREPSPAALADIELAHGRMHVAALRGLGDALREDMAAGGPTHTALDPDTFINAHTWEAALLSAGAAIDATDAVLAGELENAFCATRPPGHHACRDKAMGFCFFNNVTRFSSKSGSLPITIILIVTRSKNELILNKFYIGCNKIYDSNKIQ
jgi:acetoin utilization deacetylase AcuC-like enzyme